MKISAGKIKTHPTIVMMTDADQELSDFYATILESRASLLRFHSKLVTLRELTEVQLANGTIENFEDPMVAALVCNEEWSKRMGIAITQCAELAIYLTGIERNKE